MDPIKIFKSLDRVNEIIGYNKAVIENNELLEVISISYSSDMITKELAKLIADSIIFGSINVYNKIIANNLQKVRENCLE